MKICYFWRFWRNQEFFRKPNLFFFQKKTNSWTFWEILQSRLLSASNWLFLAVLKKTQDFFEKPIFFSQEEATFSTFWEILLNQLHPTTNFLSLAVLKKVNFFSKTLIFYLKKKQILNISRNLFIQSQCTANLLPLAIFL